MRCIFLEIWIFSISGLLDMWKLFPDILQDFNFQIWEFGEIDIFRQNVRHLAIPALSVGCSLPSGNPKSGFWLFVSMDSPLFEVIQLTEFPGNSLMDSSENWKTSEMSFMETHFLCFGCTPGVKFLEIRSAGSPLTEVNPLAHFLEMRQQIPNTKFKLVYGWSYQVVAKPIW